jgi:membrane-associated protein
MDRGVVPITEVDVGAIGNGSMDLMHHIWMAVRHMNAQNVGDLASYLGPWLYVLLFGIVFCETGLVVLPFLPGDSLLFTIGAVAATPGSGLHVALAMVLMCVAANCGDLLNYSVGYHLGPKMFRVDAPAPVGFWNVLWSKLLNRQHLNEAQLFYDRHGRKTIILARFIPIIRTFAPFVAGVGKMEFARFIGFSVAGGILWVVLVTIAGFMFGQNPFVQKNYELVLLAVVAVSVIPAIAPMIKARRQAKTRGFQTMSAGDKK